MALRVWLNAASLALAREARELPRDAPLVTLPVVPALEVFDTVSRGTAELGPGGAYYWRGKSEATQFFTTIPFGMNPLETNAWLYYGGGLELWQEVYRPFGLEPFPAGSSGVQMGGWFNRTIDSMDDLLAAWRRDGPMFLLSSIVQLVEG